MYWNRFLFSQPDGHWPAPVFRHWSYTRLKLLYFVLLFLTRVNKQISPREIGLLYSEQFFFRNWYTEFIWIKPSSIEVKKKGNNKLSLCTCYNVSATTYSNTWLGVNQEKKEHRLPHVICVLQLIIIHGPFTIIIFLRSSLSFDITCDACHLAYNYRWIK